LNVFSQDLRERIQTLSNDLAGELSKIALSAFHEGQRAGAARSRADLSAFCQARLDEIEREAAGLDPKIAQHLETNFPNVESAEVILAHIGASTLAFDSVKRELARLGQDGAAARTPEDVER
jgi:hypothetical protein